MRDSFAKAQRMRRAAGFAKRTAPLHPKTCHHPIELVVPKRSLMRDGLDLYCTGCSKRAFIDDRAFMVKLLDSSGSRGSAFRGLRWEPY